MLGIITSPFCEIKTDQPTKNQTGSYGSYTFFFLKIMKHSINNSKLRRSISGGIELNQSDLTGKIRKLEVDLKRKSDLLSEVKVKLPVDLFCSTKSR